MKLNNFLQKTEAVKPQRRVFSLDNEAKDQRYTEQITELEQKLEQKLEPKYFRMWVVGVEVGVYIDDDIYLR